MLGTITQVVRPSQVVYGNAPKTRASVAAAAQADPTRGIAQAILWIHTLHTLYEIDSAIGIFKTVLFYIGCNVPILHVEVATKAASQGAGLEVVVRGDLELERLAHVHLGRDLMGAW